MFEVCDPNRVIKPYLGAVFPQCYRDSVFPMLLEMIKIYIVCLHFVGDFFKIIIYVLFHNKVVQTQKMVLIHF